MIIIFIKESSNMASKINSEELFSVETNEANKTVVSVIKDDDNKITELDFRQYWDNTGNGTYIPTKKGVRLPISSLDTLISVLQMLK